MTPKKLEPEQEREMGGCLITVDNKGGAGALSVSIVSVERDDRVIRNSPLLGGLGNGKFSSEGKGGDTCISCKSLTTLILSLQRSIS